MKQIRSVANVSIKAAEGGQAGGTFHLVAYTGEPMDIAPFDAPIVVDLAAVDVSVQRIPILYGHDAHLTQIVGQSSKIVNTGSAIEIDGFFVLTDDDAGEVARSVYAKAKAGYVWQVSIGGDPKALDQIKAGEIVNVNGRDYAGPCYVARGVVLRETSFVVLGGDRKTTAVVAKSKGESMEFSQWLLSIGFEDEGSLSEVQKANLQQMHSEKFGAAEEAPAEEPPADPEPAPEEEPPMSAAQKLLDIKAQRKALAVEAERVAKINQLCTKADDPVWKKPDGTMTSIRAEAIAEGWTAEKTELEIMRQIRPAPAVIVRGSASRADTLSAIQGGLMVRAGLRLDHPAFQSRGAVALGVPEYLRRGINDAERNRLMEAAHRVSDMSLVDIAREACRIDGREVPHGRREIIQAAFSGSALTNIFTTNVNTQILVGYMEAGDTTLPWTSETEVADFKTNERPRMVTGPNLTKLPRGGEADHASRSDTGESYKIARYAKQMQIDEQDIIDDAFGALGDIPEQFGRAAARLRPDLVYAIILDNPTLTTTGQAIFSNSNPQDNLLGSSSLTAANLRTAVATMLLFQENGVNLNLKPTHLLLPPSLKHSGSELINSSQILVKGSTDAERGVNNALVEDNLSLISDARLENGLTDPSDGTTSTGSATSWYLVSNEAHTIEVAYLRGSGRVPQVRMFTLDRGKWGVGWDVCMDIGAKALDWRGMLKATA